MSKPVRILGIAGSLRRGSYNRAACAQPRSLFPMVRPSMSLSLMAYPPVTER